MSSIIQQSIVLSEGDARLGQYAEDGSVALWPEVDVFNKPYEKHNASLYGVGWGFFVVVPPDGMRHIEGIYTSSGIHESVAEDSAAATDDTQPIELSADTLDPMPPKRSRRNSGE